MNRLFACLIWLLNVFSPIAFAEASQLMLYPAYSDGASWRIEGRLVERRESPAVSARDGWFDNLRRSGRQFFNDERQQQLVRLRLADYHGETHTDREGYFRLAADLALPPGWHRVDAESGKGRASGELLVVPKGNFLGLISDLDDTIMISEVPKKRRLLANTFLKNPGQRLAVPGMAALYARVMAQNVQPTAAPLIYLSASPRQLHEAIAEFLERQAFPPGVLITKRITNDSSSEPRLDQFSYKTAKIEEILARLPWVRFVLVGDDGERDPEIYDWVRQHYPERVADIWIRRVSSDPQRHRPPHQKDLAEVLGAEAGANFAAPKLAHPAPQGTKP